MSGLGWELLSSEELVKTPYFRLRSDRMRLPDGAVKDAYYVLERQDATMIFAVTSAGEAVLVRQYRPPLPQEELGPPAGLVEAGEDPREGGAARAPRGDGLRRGRVGGTRRRSVVSGAEGQLSVPVSRARRQAHGGTGPGRVRAPRGGEGAGRGDQGHDLPQRDSQL